jgi:hypothetical protein
VALVAVVVALAGGFIGGVVYKNSTSTTSTSPPTTTSSSTTTTTLARAVSCTGAMLSGHAVPLGGAAGTIEEVIKVTNSTAVTCTLRGYPSLQMLNANGGILTTTTIAGQTTFSAPAANAAPALVSVVPGGVASISLKYSDVPVGSQRTCPTSASLNVFPGGSATPVNVVAQLGPCGAGTINVSAFYPG